MKPGIPKFSGPFICGPDISKQLIEVLQEVRTTFRGNGWNKSQKQELCDAVRSFSNPKQTVMGWDICQLYLPYTSWLHNPSFKRGNCGSPARGNPGTGKIESRTLSPCGNSVQVGRHCYLAGSVNYALFGEICRLCNEEFKDRLDINEMTRLIKIWKTIDFDDAGPPVAWATWAYKRLSIASPPTGANANRDYCSGRCKVQVPMRFTWRWLPHHPNCGVSSAQAKDWSRSG
jgi:hypothetical protein